MSNPTCICGGPMVEHTQWVDVVVGHGGGYYENDSEEEKGHLCTCGLFLGISGAVFKRKTYKYWKYGSEHIKKIMKEDGVKMAKEPAELEELISGIIDLWEEDTMNVSRPDKNHPAFTLVQKIDKDIVVPIVLRRMQKEFTGFFSILWQIVPKEEQPEIPEEAKGKMQKLTDIWIAWGKEEGLI